MAGLSLNFYLLLRPYIVFSLVVLFIFFKGALVFYVMIICMLLRMLYNGNEWNWGQERVSVLYQKRLFSRELWEALIERKHYL